MSYDSVRGVSELFSAGGADSAVHFLSLEQQALLGEAGKKSGDLRSLLQQTEQEFFADKISTLEKQDGEKFSDHLKKNVFPFFGLEAAHKALQSRVQKDLEKSAPKMKTALEAFKTSLAEEEDLMKTKISLANMDQAKLLIGAFLEHFKVHLQHLIEGKPLDGSTTPTIDGIKFDDVNTCYDDFGKTFHQEHMDCPVPEDCGFEDLECDLLDENHLLNEKQPRLKLKPLLNEKQLGCGSFHRVLEVIVWLMQVGFFCWKFYVGVLAQVEYTSSSSTIQKIEIS